MTEAFGALAGAPDGCPREHHGNQLLANVAFASFATFRACASHFRYDLNFGHSAAPRQMSKRAITGLMRWSKRRTHAGIGYGFARTKFSEKSP